MSPARRCACRWFGPLVAPALAAALFGLATSACVEPVEESLEQATIPGFGGMIEVRLWGVDAQASARAFASLRDDFEYMDQTWHAWKPSALGRVNELLPLGARFNVAPSVLPLIVEAQAWSSASQGLFNPALGRLNALWGFQSVGLPRGPPPNPWTIEALIAQDPGINDVVVDGISMHTENPAVQLDFGDFAKGYGLNVAARHLRELGVRNALIDAGGDLRALGRRGRQPWRTHILDPRRMERLATLDLADDESVFTVGDYERYFEHNGRRYHHVLDPRTGYPVVGTRSVTVVHRDAAKAAAAATALFVAGPERWPATARAMGITLAMLIDRSNTAHVSPDLLERLDFADHPQPLIQRSPQL